MSWQILAVDDRELENDWAIVPLWGSWLVIMRRSVYQEDRVRVLAEVHAHLPANAA